MSETHTNFDQNLAAADQQQAELEVRLDHLVDTRGISYDDARRELGIPAPHYETPVLPTRVIGGPESVPDAYKSGNAGGYATVDPAQKEVNYRGTEAVRRSGKSINALGSAGIHGA